MQERHIPPARLFRVWMNPSFTTEEVCAILMVSQVQLRRLAARQKLPPRHFVNRVQSQANDEPPPEEKAAQEMRKLECREAHMQQRRSESAASTCSKACRWRNHGL